MWEIKENRGTESRYIKIGDGKKCHKYKVGDKYCNLCMEEKLGLASDYNLNELLNH